MLKSEFLRSVLTLLSGHGIAMALSLFAAPILARIYTPGEYGVVGIFAAITSVFAVVGNWQYSQAVIIERRDQRAHVMLLVCILSTLATTSLSVIPAVFAVLFASNEYVLSNLRWWFALIPMYTFMTAMTMSLTALANRAKHYRLMASLRLGAVIVAVSTSIVLGLSGWGSHGIFMGLFADQLVMFLGYCIYLKQRPQVFWDMRDISLPRVYALMKRHRNFAFYSTPSSFVGNIAMQIPIYVLGFLGQSVWIGLFSRGRQLVMMPVTLAANSVAQVYQQRASVEYRETNACWNVFRKTALMLFLVGLGPVVVLIAYGPALCEFVLGPDWRAAGEVVQVLAPMLLMRFVCNPLATTFHVVGAQRDDLRFSLLSVVLVSIGVMLAAIIECSPYSILVGYSLGYSIAYLLYTLRAGWLAAPRPSSITLAAV